MEALIRSAGVAAQRRRLREKPGQPPAVATEPYAETPVDEEAGERTHPEVGPDLAAQCALLRAELEAQRLAADELLAERERQLEQERAMLRKEAAEQAARAVAEAAKRGHAEGLERGIADGRDSLREQAKRATALCAALGEARAQAIDMAEDSTVELAFAAVCRMLGSEAGLHAAVQKAVGEMRVRMDAETMLTVGLHPDDVASLSAQGGQGHDVKLVPDTQVALGGCRIASATGTLDARLDTQLERLRAVLLEVRLARRNGEGRSDA